MGEERTVRDLIIMLKQILGKGFFDESDLEEIKRYSIEAINYNINAIKAPKVDITNIAFLALLYTEASRSLDRHTDKEVIYEEIKKNVIDSISKKIEKMGKENRIASRFFLRMRSALDLVDPIFKNVLEVSKMIEEAMEMKKPIGKNIISRFKQTIPSGAYLWEALWLPKYVFALFYVMPYLDIKISIRDEFLEIEIFNQSIFSIHVTIFVDKLKVGEYNLDGFQSKTIKKNIKILLGKVPKIKAKIFVFLVDLRNIDLRKEYVLDFSGYKMGSLLAVVASFYKDKIGYNLLLFDELVNNMCQFSFTKNVDLNYIYDITEEMLKKIENDTDINECAKILTDQLIPQPMKEILQNTTGHIVLVTDNHYIPWESLIIGEQIISEKFGFIRQFMASKPFYKPYSEIKKAILLANTDGSLPNSLNEISNIHKIFQSYGILHVMEIFYKQFDDKNFLQRLLSKISSPVILHISTHLKFVDGAPYIPLKLSTGENDSISFVSLLNAINVDSLLFFNMCQSLSSETFRILLATILEEGKNLLGFIGTRTIINDSLSIEFSSIFYHSLLNRKTFAESILMARKAAMKVSRSRWLSFIAFGNPQWRLR